MYNKKHICTYQYYDPTFYSNISEPFCKKNVKGLEMFAEDLYRVDIEQTFQIKNIDEVLKLLETHFEKHDDIVLLFSYNFFYLTHKCICSDFCKADVDQLMFVLRKENIILKKIKDG